MYLLDTMVISELRKKNINSGLSKWFITIGEIRKDFCIKEKYYPIAAKPLTDWLGYILNNFSKKFLLHNQHFPKKSSHN